MHDSTPATVTVGLDVHAASIRLAAISPDELLDERTLLYDHEAVERELSPGGGALLLRGWPDRLRPLPPPNRARDLLRGGGGAARAARGSPPAPPPRGPAPGSLSWACATAAGCRAPPGASPAAAGSPPSGSR